MPSSLAASGTVAPVASFASAWRSLRTICSGECRLPIKSPPSARPGPLDSHSNWTSFRGAGQIYNPEIAEAVCRDRKTEWEYRFECKAEIHSTKIYLLDGSVKTTTRAQQLFHLLRNRTWHSTSEVTQFCLRGPEEAPSRRPGHLRR